MFLNHALVSQRYFFPRRDVPASLFFVEVKGARLGCYSEVRDPTAPTMIYFHGNGETVADYVPHLSSVFLDMGMNVLFAEYRGYGASTGVPELLTMLEDTESIFASLGIPAEQVYLFGRSVGSIYAIELAHRHPGVAGLIIESGIADPLERVLLRVDPEELGATREQIDEEARQFLDHRDKLSHYKGRLLVLHAAGDHLIELSHAHRNRDWAGGEEKKLVVFDRGDHNSILMMNQRRYFEEVQTFLSDGPDNSGSC